MSIRKRLIRWVKKVWGLPLVYRVPAIVLFLLIFLYLIAFLPSKGVELSYAKESTCVSYPTLLPGLLRQSGDMRFQVRAEGIISIAGVAVAATKACVTPLQAPTAGVSRTAVSLGGGWLFKKKFIIRSGQPPVANVALLGKPLPTSQLLAIQLSSTDKIFHYQVEANGKRTSCSSGEKTLLCDIPSLKLLQGKAYRLRLERAFHADTPQVIADQKIMTLAATRVVKL